MLKRALIYGALIALAGAVLTFIVGSTDLAENRQAAQVAGIVGFLFPIVGIVLAIRAAKSADPGPFSFGDGFKLGAAVTVAAAVLGAVFTYLYVTAINPEYIETVRATAAEQLRDQGLKGRELETAQSAQTAMTSPGALAGLGFIGQLIFGLIVSAIAAAIMRRKEQPSTGDGYGGYTTA